MGIIFCLLQVDILLAVSLIGLTTFLLSAVGVKAGPVWAPGASPGRELAGGLVLVLMGCKILLEHLGVLS